MIGERTWSGRLAHWWVSVYTSGLVPEVRDRRRDEIASDVWEQQEEARAFGEAPTVTARAVLTRVITGVPADLRWRIEMRYEERWERRANRALAAQHQHDRIEPLAIVLQSLRPRVRGYSEDQPTQCDDPRRSLDAVADLFEVPALPPILREWLGNEGHVFLEGFPFAGSEADVNAYDDALQSASIRLDASCPRRRRGHHFSRRTRALLEARLRGVGLDVRGPDGGEHPPFEKPSP